MGTIREYFDTDAKTMAMHATWQVRTADGAAVGDVIAKVAYDFEANAKYWYFFVPSIADLTGCLNGILHSADTAVCQLSSAGDGVFVEQGFAEYSERQSTETLQFTKRVHLYLDFALTPDNRRSLCAQALELGYFLSIRDHEYAQSRSSQEKPMAFISHDSRDKEGFVRELALELTKNYCRVWYDEYSLNVGDSLRASIENGLRETAKCIVILSPRFLSNSGWGLAEFDSIYTREIVEKKNVMLPVWLDVGVEEVYKYSPRLADKVGLPSTLGIPEVARRLANAVRASTE